MSLIANERTKLFANALDRASTACVAVGLFTPIVTGNTVTAASVFGFMAWILAALVLHLLAHYVLGDLIE